MYERLGGVVDEFPMEMLPSPDYPHLWILGQLPGEVEGEGDLDGSALDPREVCWLVDPITIFSAGSCRVPWEGWGEYEGSAGMERTTRAS